LAVGSDDGITVWNMSDATATAPTNGSLATSFPVHSTFHPRTAVTSLLTLQVPGDGKSFVCGTRSGTLFLFQYIDKFPHYKSVEYPTQMKGSISCLCTVGNGCRFASSDGGGDGRIEIWSGKWAQKLTTERTGLILRGHRAGVRCMMSFTSCTTGAHFIVSGSMDGDVRIWNLGLGTCVKRLSGHRGPVTHIAMSNSTTLVTLATDHIARWWSVEDDYIASIGLNVSNVQIIGQAKATSISKKSVWIAEKQLHQQNVDIGLVTWEYDKPANVNTHKAHSKSFHLRCRKSVMPSSNLQSDVRCFFSLDNDEILIGYGNGCIEVTSEKMSTHTQDHHAPVVAIDKIRQNIYCTGGWDGIVSILYILDGQLLHSGVVVERPKDPIIVDLT